MSEDRDALAVVDAIAQALVDRARPCVVRIARTPEEMEAAQRLRGAAVLAHQWLTADQLVDGRDVDADDARATHLVVMLGNELIGTCRLVYPEPGRLLPMEQRPGAGRVPADAVEVGRISATKGNGRVERSMTAALIGRAWLEIRANGYQRICGTVSAGVLRLYRRLGFLVQVIGPSVTLFGEERYPILFEPTPAAAALAANRAEATGSMADNPWR